MGDLPSDTESIVDFPPNNRSPWNCWRVIRAEYNPLAIRHAVAMLNWLVQFSTDEMTVQICEAMLKRLDRDFLNRIMKA